MAGKSHVSHPSYAHVSVPYLCMLFFICWRFLISYPDLPRPREKQSEIWVRDKAVPSPLLLPPPYPPPPGGFPYEGGENARRLFKGCKFRILVSLRVF